MTGVAVYDTLKEFGLKPDIKWVNDVLIGEKKISGILAETVETPTGLAVIVGIGINLTSEIFRTRSPKRQHRSRPRSDRRDSNLMRSRRCVDPSLFATFTTFSARRGGTVEIFAALAAAFDIFQRQTCPRNSWQPSCSRALPTASKKTEPCE